MADAFIMPEIKINGCDKHFTIYYNIDFEKFMSQFVQTNGGSTMLITGVPGIGKTCITSWIAHDYLFFFYLYLLLLLFYKNFLLYFSQKVTN